MSDTGAVALSVISWRTPSITKGTTIFPARDADSETPRACAGAGAGAGAGGVIDGVDPLRLFRRAPVEVPEVPVVPDP